MSPNRNRYWVAFSTQLLFHTQCYYSCPLIFVSISRQQKYISTEMTVPSISRAELFFLDRFKFPEACISQTFSPRAIFNQTEAQFHKSCAGRNVHFYVYCLTFCFLLNASLRFFHRTELYSAFFPPNLHNIQYNEYTLNCASCV